MAPADANTHIRLRRATLAQVCWMRKKYVPLYIKAMQSHQMGGDEETRKMDETLPEATILLFRRLAHVQARV